MKPDGPGYKLAENDIDSLAYQLLYGQRFTGYALWKYVGWQDGLSRVLVAFSRPTGSGATVALSPGVP